MCINLFVVLLVQPFAAIEYSELLLLEGSNWDVNGIGISRPYSNSIWFGMVFIHSYPYPNTESYIFMMSIFITILSSKN